MITRVGVRYRRIRTSARNRYWIIYCVWLAAKNQRLVPTGNTTNSRTIFEQLSEDVKWATNRTMTTHVSAVDYKRVRNVVNWFHNRVWAWLPAKNQWLTIASNAKSLKSYLREWIVTESRLIEGMSFPGCSSVLFIYSESIPSKGSKLLREPEDKRVKKWDLFWIQFLTSASITKFSFFFSIFFFN